MISVLTIEKEKLVKEVDRNVDEIFKGVAMAEERMKGKREKFDRFLYETERVIKGVERKGMDREGFEKVKEVYGVVCKDLEEWEEDGEGLGKVKEFEVFEGEIKIGEIVEVGGR